jgi:hypothetical protein
VLGNRPFVRANLVAAALTAATTPPMLMSILYQQQELGPGVRESRLTGFRWGFGGAALIALAGLATQLPGRRAGAAACDQRAMS